MSIYITGDIHGNPFSRFSFSQNPAMRELTENDIVMILGDVGIVFGDKHSAATAYELNWCASQKYHFIFLLGNHDDWEWAYSLPIVEKYNGQVRQCVYDGVEYDIDIIVDPTVLMLQGKKCLCIPGAKSHDIWNLLNPQDKVNYKLMKKKLDMNFEWYRTIGKDYWSQEIVDVDKCKEVITANGEKYDYILSHEAPSGIAQCLQNGFDCDAAQRYLEEIAWSVNFYKWYHGHYHFDASWMSLCMTNQKRDYWYKMYGIMHDIIELF